MAQEKGAGDILQRYMRVANLASRGEGGEKNVAEQQLKKMREKYPGIDAQARSWQAAQEASERAQRTANSAKTQGVNVPGLGPVVPGQFKDAVKAAKAEVPPAGWLERLAYNAAEWLAERADNATDTAVAEAERQAEEMARTVDDSVTAAARRFKQGMQESVRSAFGGGTARTGQAGKPKENTMSDIDIPTALDAAEEEGNLELFGEGTEEEQYIRLEMSIPVEVFHAICDDSTELVAKLMEMFSELEDVDEDDEDDEDDDDYDYDDDDDDEDGW